MAMWFAHLHFAHRAASCAEVDRHELAWGALCCDVDKFTSVDRPVSHYGREGLDFEPEEWGARTRLSPEAIRHRRVFLAGYLSHMALDEAWYGWLQEQLGQVDTGGWTGETTRAWNLVMDLELRPGVALDLDFPFGVEEVLGHLRGAPAQAMRQAASAYIAWDGGPEAAGLHPLMQGFARLAHARLDTERERVQRLVDACCSASLFQTSERFVNDAVVRFLAST